IVKTSEYDGIVNGECTSDVGDTIAYTFTVTNEGNVDLSNVTVTDPLLEAPNPVVTIAGPTGDDGDGILQPTETWVYTADYAITQADINAGMVTNQATATGTPPTGDDVTDLSGATIDDDLSTDTEICQTADIAIVKTSEYDPIVNGECTSDVGDTIAYTFTVTNEGNVDLSNVTVTDPLLQAPNPVVTIAGPAGDDGDGILQPTETWVYTAEYAITQADIDAGIVNNQATVVGTPPTGADVTDLSGATIDDDLSTDTLVCQEASIAVIKVGTVNDINGSGCADPKETITYTFTVVNTGNVTLTNIDIDDPLVNVVGGPITLGPNETDNTSFTAVYSIRQSDIDRGFVTNQATVTGLDPNNMVVSDLSDDNSLLEDDDTVTQLCQNGVIALIKTGTPTDQNGNGCVDEGETIVYDFVVTNLGNVALTNVIITDPLVSVSGGPITLLAGASDTETFSAIYTVVQGDVDRGFVSNQATASGTTPNGTVVTDLSDNNSNFEDDATIVNLCQMPMISLEKSGLWNDENGDGAAQAGETVTYFFNVINTGTVTVFNITLTDPLPGIEITGGPIAQLDPGQNDNTTFSGTYVVTEADVAAGQVVNQATATGTDSNGNEVSDTSDDPSILVNVDPDGDGDPDDPTVTILPGVQNPGGFEIFNGITPDEDGLNDFFNVFGIQNFGANNMKIFNRWGVLVFETNNYGGSDGQTNVFRGRSEGRATVREEKDLPTGTYFYILTFTDDPNIPGSNPGKQNYTGYLYINR
ncbi:gliding motility-associated C-terminal domain-containing protein, partial [Jejudonia soesokkakensis]